MSDFAGKAAAVAIRTALERCGAGVAFGLPGGANLALFQELRGSRTRLVVPTHELAAAFMAGTYGRVFGRPGVLLTIPGPGFAYALPGIAEAWQDSAPLIHIVKGPPEPKHQRFRFQGLDQAAIARPIVKAILAASELSQIDATIGAAFETAQSGEPGPVLVELGRSESWQRVVPPDNDIAAARAVWARIHTARKPVLLLGQGCVHSAQMIGAYVERTGTPVFTTPSGRGVVPESSPWCLCYDAPKNSTGSLNAFLGEADLIIAVGARLAHNATAGFSLSLPAERLVHVDAAAANLGTVYPAVATAAVTAECFFAMPESTGAPRTNWSLEGIATWRARLCAVHDHEAEPLVAGGTAQEFFARLRSALPDDALLVTDSGLHQVLARRYFEVRRPHGLLLPTDLQSMGFGLPSAIAAKLANPSRSVVALIGDGGALMSGLELAVAVREQIAMTAIVFNDGYLNQIRQQQLRDCGRSYGVQLPAVDFQSLAEAVGAAYIASDTDLKCLGATTSTAGVTLIEVPVSDSGAITANIARSRAKALIKSALGPRLGAIARGWLRR